MINNPTNNYTYPSFTTTPPYANLRENTENSNSNSNNKPSKSKPNKLGQQTSTSTISHATRIEPTNLSYKDLLRKHQFTPQSGDSTPQTSPMKQEFDLNNNPNNKIITRDMTPLELEIQTFRRKPIIEEPKKPVSGYQLFAKWKRREKPDEIDANYPQSKALSIEWNALPQPQRDAWNKKADIEKLQYQQQKEEWLKYVQEAKTLGIPVPTKSVKPMIQQIKIKNLLNLIPNICKSNKETTFIISKATEMFIQYYASKAIDISQRTCTSENESFITPLHCFHALQTSHQFNFLRAVTAKPENHKKNIKKRKRNSKPKIEKDTGTLSDPPKKKRKMEEESNSELAATNQIITTGPEVPSTTPVTPVAAVGGYPTYAAAYPYIANGSYSHGYYGQPMINGMAPIGTPMAPVAAPFSAVYQPPNPFTHPHGYSPKYAINNNMNNTQTQIVNVQQIFGSDE